jgi:hypothetical protein
VQALIANNWQVDFYPIVLTYSGCH